ncbi:hypothetical protein [Acaryochloris marina]|uniref:Uncharacterized protein n=1 Tax=Acaryochloris marina (strain MBIC 11017) TaxID=329726 RepID=B0C6U4_ACAM1|nr:hypothetical protein [Acaryochloris marina]ABW27648.1 hypothetical protein AM1_2641 [Acaryochloris marina MBIC11017]BDM82383.1 hypothetical protein AM10699_52440 [Acaryochloris marina MBIC10699]
MTGIRNLDNLQALRLTTDDLEAQTAFTTTSFWVGSLWGGVYRLSVWRQPQHWLRVLGVEMIALALLGMLSVPVGLIPLRDTAHPHRFLQVTGTATGLMFASWHLYLWHRTQTLRPLLQLLDDIDQYNQLVETVILLAGLTQANPSALTADHTLILDVLHTSRTSLVTALNLERLIRQHQRLIHRNQALLDLDQALITLKGLELQDQAQDYQDVIQAALQISTKVQTTMRQLSQS